MPIELRATHPTLPWLKLEIGDKWRGVLVDINPVAHYVFGTKEIETDKHDRPKTKWIARLRANGATTSADDLEWWTHNQIKKSLEQEVEKYPGRYLGAEIGIERLADGEPSNKAFKAPHNYRVVIIKPGAVGWVDPFKGVPATEPEPEDEPF